MADTLRDDSSPELRDKWGRRVPQGHAAPKEAPALLELMRQGRLREELNEAVSHDPDLTF